MARVHREAVVIVRCTDRHQLEGHLRTMAIAWSSRAPESRGEHGAAVVRLARAVRVLLGGAS